MNIDVGAALTVSGIVVEVVGLSVTFISLRRWWENADGPRYQWLRDELKPVEPERPRLADGAIGYVTVTVEDPEPSGSIAELESRVSEGNKRLRAELQRENEKLRATLGDVLERITEEDEEEKKQARLDVRQASAGVVIVGIGALLQLAGAF